MRARVTAMLVTAITVAIVAGAAAGSPSRDCPRGHDRCVDNLIAEMQQGADRLGCDHNRAFALLYLRTTEAIREALRAGEFTDRRQWNSVTTGFGRYYLDAFAAWRHGQERKAPEAWRIAFRAAERERVSTLGDVFLGINAHVNRDLAFIYHRHGVRDHAGHLVVNTVLARVQPVVYPELMALLDPTLPAQTSIDPKLSLDIVAWRERAWENAKRLAAARGRVARRAVARAIERHSVRKARRIRAAFPATAETSRARDAYCAAHGGTSGATGSRR